MGTCSPSCLSVDKVDKKTPFREEGQHRPPPEIAPGKGAIFFCQRFSAKAAKDWRNKAPPAPAAYNVLDLDVHPDLVR